MKERKTLKVGIILAILSIMSICVVSGTYAKYAAMIEGIDTARVAKFNYTATGLSKDTTTINLFDTTSDTGILTSEKVVAPGTEGTFQAGITNSGEVTIKAKYTIEETANAGSVPIVYVYEGKYYSSVLATGNTVKKHAGDAANITIDGDLTDLATEVSAISDTLGAAASANVTIGWFWAFEGVTASQTDITDTALGVKTASDTISVKITCNVEQTDAL